MGYYNKKCAYCGNKSYSYELCSECYRLATDGVIIKNDNTGEWEEVETEKNKECVICNAKTKNGYLFCKDCFSEIKDIINTFNHNKDAWQVSEQYFTIKRESLQSVDKEIINENVLYLYALADEYSVMHDSNYLINRVSYDIKEVLKTYNSNLSSNQVKFKSNFNDEDFRNKWPRDYQCDDGHYVRSLSEKLIDDWLYQNGYVHAYEKSVFMATNPDDVVLSDFYLPQLKLYIEFWGVEDDEKYLKRKEYKIKLYDENNYRRLDLTEKDIKRLNDIMPRLLAKYEK